MRWWKVHFQDIAGGGLSHSLRGVMISNGTRSRFPLREHFGIRAPLPFAAGPSIW
jgi:hypothetical protein